MVIITSMGDDLLHWDWSGNGVVHGVVGEWYLPMAGYANNYGIHMMEFYTSWNPVNTPVTFDGIEMVGWWSFNIYWTPGNQYSSYSLKNFVSTEHFYRIEYWAASYDVASTVSINYSVPEPSISLIMGAFLCLLKKGNRNAFRKRYRTN